MRPSIRVAVEDDPNHKGKRRILIHTADVERVECVADNLSLQDSTRMQIAVRKAFLAGMHWMREDTSSYVLSLHPDVVCVAGGL